MAVYKDGNRWKVYYRYTDWQGNKKQTTKRGFLTKRDAQAWEREELNKATTNLDMTFESFVDTYTADMQSRVKETTWATKEYMITKKLLPYLGKRKMSSIQPKDVLAWQNEMMNYRDGNGKAYSQTYLKSLNNQLVCILNHAVKFYGLANSPAKKVSSIGKKKGSEMQFWTKEEYLKFADEMRDKPLSYYTFQMLYWCGVRVGEMLALTPADFDFKKKTVSISKSYQRLKKRDIVTSPKTEKGNRIISMPQFLCDEIQDYLKTLYAVGFDERMFPITKSYLHKEMDRGAKGAGVKRIRIHDLRHSHISLLIDRGFTAIAIADRVGHESIDITLNYAHLFPSRQDEMANKLDAEWEVQ